MRAVPAGEFLRDLKENAGLRLDGGQVVKGLGVEDRGVHVRFQDPFVGPGPGHDAELLVVVLLQIRGNYLHAAKDILIRVCHIGTMIILL